MCYLKKCTLRSLKIIGGGGEGGWGRWWENIPPCLSSSDGPGIDVDGIGNLMNLPRLTFMDEECGNLKVVVDCGELTKNINREEKSGVLQA